MNKKKKNLLHRGKLSKRLKQNNSRHRKRRSEKERRRFTEKPNSTTKAIKEGKSLRDKVKNLKMRPMLFMTKLKRYSNRLDVSKIERPSDKRSGNFECEPINAKLRVKCQPINADLRV
jgi:hypothetical protein